MKSYLRQALGLLVAGALALPQFVALGAPQDHPGKYDRSGIDGSRQASMQPVNTGARVSLVASVPAGSEAWAVGTSSAKVPGWASEKGGEQTVFLRYTGDTWEITGPPIDSEGKPQNPRVTSLSVASNGTGWAVGDGGVMLRLDRGQWIAATKKTVNTLKSVSIGPKGDYGFAVGEGPVALRLTGGDWQLDPLPAEGETWDLLDVAAAGPSDAWAAGGDSSAALIVRRTASGWQRVQTGKPLFDQQGVRTVEGMQVISTRANAVSAGLDGAWVGGTIVPVDVSINDPAGDSTRPFALWASTSGTVTSYCPDRYPTTGEGSIESICDKPFPLSGFGLVDVHYFGDGPGGEAFAGGLGLFHFRGGTWFREPNPISFLSSISFASPTEGWVGGTGGVFGAAISATKIGTLGHWTQDVETPNIARWPQPISDLRTFYIQPLEGVALAPDKSRRAIAVGGGGVSYIYKPEIGWDASFTGTNRSLHDLVWPTPSTAWAVGSFGTILRFDGSSWSINVSSGSLTNAALFGVAMTSGRGYAVGANGTILEYSGGRWSQDPANLKLTDVDLLSVDNAGDQFIAVGADGTILLNEGEGWIKDSSAENLLRRGGRLPALYAVDGLSDGTALIGGESSTLIRRDGYGSWRVDVEGSRVPPEGTILAVSAYRSGGDLNLYVSVSYESLKYAGELPGVITGFVLHGTSNGWRELGYNTRLTTYPSFDASGIPDPVLDIASEGSTAWAVGGTGPGNDDGQGHVQSFPTSSIYRVDLRTDPRPTGHTIVPTLDDDPDLINFAFFGESTCGNGLCSPTMGSGTKADAVASQIQREINGMTKLPGGPRFILFGGNMRRAGIPEELGQFKKYSDGFEVPFFASLGSTDLFYGLRAETLQDTPNPYGATPDTELPTTSDDAFWRDAFADRPAPWGKRPVSGFIPVQIGAQAGPGARTHYSFDYVQKGKTLRIIVLDDSVVGRLTDASTQNPQQDQRTWLTEVLNDAKDRRDRGEKIASIIVMNRPYKNPVDTVRQEPHPEVVDIQNVAAQVGASAVFTSFFRANAVIRVTLEGVGSTVPVFTFGGGGAPLEARDGRPPYSSLGMYHSWQLVSVNFSPSRRVPPLGQAEVYVKSFPVVDHVALHAIDGASVIGGHTLRFTGSARATEGGGPNDPLQSAASLIGLDSTLRGVCPPDYRDRNRPKCVQSGGVGPTFEYSSENPSIGYFVRPSELDPSLPVIDPTTGRPIPDSSSGLFCAVGLGTTHVSVISGFHRARMKVTVGPGTGPCVRDPVVAPPEIPRIPVPIEAPLALSVYRPLHPPVSDLQPWGIVIPPTVPVIAPAPPAAGGYAKREEHEEATQTEASEFRALRHQRRFNPAINPRGRTDPVIWWMTMAAITFAGAIASVALIQFETRKSNPALVRSNVGQGGWQ